MTIKKQYQELINFLQSNSDVKVSEIINEVKKMCESSSNARTFVKDSDGNTVAIFCYFHKQWEFVSEVEYGKKSSNKATGLNTMCKYGLKGWNQTQKELKNLESKLLTAVINGEVETDELQELKEQRSAQIREEVFNEYALSADLYHTFEEVNQKASE